MKHFNFSTYLILVTFLCCSLLPLPTNGQLDFLRHWFDNLFGLSPSDEDSNDDVSVSSSRNSRKIEEKVNSVLWSLEGRLDDLITDLGNFNSSLDEVTWCYEPKLRGQTMNIFDGSTNFRTVAVGYYVSFCRKMFLNF